MQDFNRIRIRNTPIKEIASIIVVGAQQLSGSMNLVHPSHVFVVVTENYDHSFVILFVLKSFE